jgi:hypothetical protein
MVESLNPRATFVAPRTGLSAESAARRLLQIIQRTDIDVGQYAYTGATNSIFTREGGTVAEYAAGVAYGTERGWFVIDRSGTRIVLLQAGRDL